MYFVIENSTEFAHLVKEMREMQKEYFSTRTRTSLTKSIKLEKKVDEYLAFILPDYTQQGLL